MSADESKNGRVTTVCLDIGSNIDRKKNIQACVDQLLLDFPDIIFSKAYESEAFGFEGDPFINLSAKLSTDKTFDQLNRYLKSLEDKQARARDTQKFISRTLDVDILLFGDLILQPDIDLPRAEILKFPFVLFPLAEIAADMIHPIEKKPINDIVKCSTLEKHTLTKVNNFPKISQNP